MQPCTRLLALTVLFLGTIPAFAQQVPHRDAFTSGTVSPIRPSRDVTAPVPPAISGNEVVRSSGTPTGGNKAGRSLLSLGSGDSVGYTMYDFQTNGAMPDRIINWPSPVGVNGFLSTMIAMASTTPAPNYDDRGTYGSIAIDGGNGLEWLPITIDSWRRIESERTGFCDLAHLSDGRAVFTSHAANRILFSREIQPGTGEFTTVDVPGADRGLWARVAVGENDYVHVIWTYQNTEPEFHILKYTRSTDGGQTWDTPVDLTGAGSVTGTNIRGVQGGDAYAIAANGPHVVVWYFSQSVQVIQLRSRDNGATWDINDAIVVAQPNYQRIYSKGDDPDSLYWTDPEISADSAVGFRSDTAVTSGSSFDLLVESDGRVRGVYPVYPTYLVRYYLNGGDTTATTFQSGIIYQADRNYTDAAFFYFTELDNLGSRSLVPLPPGMVNPNRFLDVRGYTSGFARWPNLGHDGGGNLYLVYTSGADGDWVTATAAGESTEYNYYRGHTYVTWTPDGVAWADPLNLSPNGIDAQYATLADDVDDELHIAYQADTYPGDYLTSSGTGGSTLHPEIRNNHEVLIVPKENLNTISVDGSTSYTGAAVSILPNPVVKRALIAVTIPKAGTISVDLFNAMGTRVQRLVEARWTEAGQFSQSVSTDGLAAGTYFVRLHGPGGVMTTPFRIVR